MTDRHEVDRDLLADKLAAAAELVRHTEQDSSADCPDWRQVLRDLELLAQTVASAAETAAHLGQVPR